MSAVGRNVPEKKIDASSVPHVEISIPLRFYRSGGKRVFDVTIALVGSLMISPLFFLISILILLIDGWPIFFLQKRVGMGGKPFTILKFRTMSNSPESTPAQFRPGDCSSVTSLGRFLRKTKLDELPQLINVIFGHMALVGPRPEVPVWTNIYAERWQNVLSIRPGITDAASIAFRNEESILAASVSPTRTYQNDILPKKLDMYESYVESYTLVGDIRIFVKTLVGFDLSKDNIKID